jgi:hypothetical protein
LGESYSGDPDALGPARRILSAPAQTPPNEPSAIPSPDLSHCVFGQCDRDSGQEASTALAYSSRRALLAQQMGANIWLGTLYVIDAVQIPCW